MNFHQEHYSRVIAAKEQKKINGIPDVFKVAVSVNTFRVFPEIIFPFKNSQTSAEQK